MTEEDKEIIKGFIKETIKEVVNGKIDRLDKKIDTHNAKHEQDMADIKPYMQAASGLGLLWKGLVALGGLALVWAQIRASI